MLIETAAGTGVTRLACGRIRCLAVVVLAVCSAFGGGVAPAGAQSSSDIDVSSLSAALARNAKQLCSVIFVVGRSPEEAMAIGDVVRWERLVEWWDWDQIDVRVDTDRARVTVGRYPAPPRTAVFHEDQGCSMLPAGESEVFYEPVKVTPNLPPAESAPWPVGDLVDGQKVRGIDRAAVESVLETAFSDNNPERGERGWVVLHDGRIVGERYAPGYDEHTRNLSFSEGKSIEVTLAGILVGAGHLDVDDPAPIKPWEAPDARSRITTKNLLQMASGLDCNTYPLTHPLHFTPQNHHSVGYNEGVNAFQASIAPSLRFVPGTVNRYRNCDLLAVGMIIRDVVEREYDIEYLAFPQRYLFDRIGVRSAVVEPDPYGNLLFNGHNYLSTRDWARFGLLYLQDGVFDGERILPRGWADFVSTPSIANPGYGAFFWLATEEDDLPVDAYWASGAEGNRTMIIPSHGLVVAKNAWSPTKDFQSLVGGIVSAVIKTASDCEGSGWNRYGFDAEDQCRTYVEQRGEIVPTRVTER
jgi:CubicO group peptidase (beta-lactamase class C family)